jgi:hypothetical protein
MKVLYIYKIEIKFSDVYICCNAIKWRRELLQVVLYHGKKLPKFCRWHKGIGNFWGKIHMDCNPTKQNNLVKKKYYWFESSKNYFAYSLNQIALKESARKPWRFWSCKSKDLRKKNFYVFEFSRSSMKFLYFSKKNLNSTEGVGWFVYWLTRE